MNKTEIPVGLGRKDRIVRFRCTSRERDEVQSTASELGLSMSAYVLALHRRNLAKK